MLKNKFTMPALALGVMLLGGVAAGLTSIASAQTTPTPTTTSVVAPVNPTIPATNSVAPQTHMHAPLGGDGIVSSVNGTTIVMGEEADEGGASYTIDASKASVTMNGATGTLADIKVGEKIFVQGAVNGTNVVAASVSVGHPEGMGKDNANDADGSATSEASEPASSSSAVDQ